jgi:hypothetical protein
MVHGEADVTDLCRGWGDDAEGEKMLQRVVTCVTIMQRVRRCCRGWGDLQRVVINNSLP